MYPKTLARLIPIFLLALTAAVLAACATPGGSTGDPTQPATQAPPMKTATPAPVEPELRPLDVMAVSVEIGQGSPIPVKVIASGSWPDLCAQLAQVDQRIEDASVDIRLLATPLEPDCPPDYVGVPFRIAIPLNMVEMPPGTYTVAVNGVETQLVWQTPGKGTTSEAPAVDDLRPIQVEHVSVEVGVGSPIPVEIVASGSWPDLCAQLARVETRMEGSHIEISLLASGANPSCPPDYLGLPFGMAIPLNVVELPSDSFTVAVNGVETSFEWPAAPPQSPGMSELPAMTLAYTGPDGNIWVLDTPNGEPRQITQDASHAIPGGAPSGERIDYYFPQISSDGTLVAFRRDAGKPIASGYEYTFGLWVYDRSTGESRQVYDQNPGSFAWKPGEHLLAFGQGVPEGYFTARGEIDSALATGIMGVDVDTGATRELVAPERGYALHSPEWSPDGRALAFQEVYTYEGSGLFAFYDFEAREYVAWDEPIGLFDWSPDSAQIAYDRMTYAATGGERIYLQGRLDEEGELFSPDYPAGYAFFPVFSPQGDHIAYLANHGGPDSQTFALSVQSLAGGDPLELGQFESVLSLGWSPDGSHLVFSAGPYESQDVLAVRVADGHVTTLAQGNSPALAGQ